MQIPITKIVVDELEKEAIIKPLETGWIVQGPYVKEFEQRFAEFVGCKYAKATTSGTTALHLALLASNIGPGDKVIVPAFTYVASANAVEYTGAEVVFADIDISTFNIDISKLENILANDRHIKAIMPVNLFGLCASLSEILLLAKKYNLKVIEDSACGFDSWIDNQHSGTFGDSGCFSFHPRKSITTGEGGMVVTDDIYIYNKVSQLCDHGAAKRNIQSNDDNNGALLPDFNMRGYNYRMTDFQGVLGVCQMGKAKFISEGRRKIAAKYESALCKSHVLKIPITPPTFKHSYQSYVCLFLDGYQPEDLTIEIIEELNQKRNKFMRQLEHRGISTRQGTHAVHSLAYYAQKYDFKPEYYKNAYIGDKLSIALPLYPQMTENEFDYVINAIHELA